VQSSSTIAGSHLKEFSCTTISSMQLRARSVGSLTSGIVTGGTQNRNDFSHSRGAMPSGTARKGRALANKHKKKGLVTKVIVA
jgi:hypothetical protein